MTRRVIINREEIDRFIIESAIAFPPELALSALRKPLLNERELYVPVTVMPKDPPWWLTEEAIGQGNIVVFEAGQIKASLMLATKWRVVKRWLEDSPVHLRDNTTRAGRKWMSRLRHIKTLDEAVTIAVRETAQWDRKETSPDEVAELFRPDFGAELEKRGEIVRITPAPEGRVWFELLSERAILHEGIVMENCLSGQERHNYLGSRARLFSLRGNNRDEQVTVGILPWKKWVAERRLNGPIRDADNEAIQILLNFIGYEDPMKALFARLQKLRREM